MLEFNVVDYAPIANCFAEASRDGFTLPKTKKFDIVYGQEENHGVNLGVGYKNSHVCAMFVSFIAKEQKSCLANSLLKTSLFVFLSFKPMPVLMLEMWSSELF